MAYKVHHLAMKGEIDEQKLELFLNTLKGEVVSITPFTRHIFYFVYRLDCLIIVEKID